MSERQGCVRCQRAIDEWARICPYCNWDQSKPAPAQATVPAPVTDYKPPEERSAKQLMAMGGAGLLLLVLAFLVGMIINRDGAPKNAPVPVTEEEQATPGAGPRRADTPLVPMNEPGGIAIEQPITSAPASGPQAGTPAEWNRTDATAVSAAEYAQMAKRAQAEKKAAPLVDPRSITGAAYAQASRQPAGRPASPSAVAAGGVAMTRPVPQYQPVPRLRGSGRAKLDLVIGPDGRVRDIDVRRAFAGDTPALIGAVQRWRFKPATVNGRPVASRYSVEISFRQ
ncbi:MAG TPA: TonB family protein [Thermoanaerobaculia bacterium]|nr:TonB family protein [Thermoanaerobaculia bacterium]